MIVYNTTFHIEKDILDESLDYLKKTVYPESRGERFPTAAMPATCDAG